MKTENEMKDLELAYLAANESCDVALNACREAQASRMDDNPPANSSSIYFDAHKIYTYARSTARNAWHVYDNACVDAGITNVFEYKTYSLYEEF